MSQTPLFLAALNNRQQIVELLIRLGADVNVKIELDDAFMTPLLSAAISGRDILVKTLIDAGASINIVLGDFPPIVEMARQAGHESTVKIIEDAISQQQKQSLLGNVDSSHLRDLPELDQIAATQRNILDMVVINALKSYRRK